ncbi:phosphatidylinositol 3,4,5-trisphosphate 3-phosphatase and dual-specificity protein phosphatase PTEN isoform X2 [Microplitis mediator]|uniref:phosphatidylinositol 3,4,5-trisphosphate 3-phosphatase and dual-specificity protein phosphatase PTEN isoform X2 n=1 Tax=Microplitis mediator TaxID=375433 RepID=UPI002554D0B5|nr:phosphatidylinositol 3,4,5-trisphosphate 3-phosphatase and dual-specificity protein phosphatase PTEN isoform X2 [Microplitis mediator]
MLYALMGICFSCRRPSSSRLNNKISEHISASVTPLHVCLEEQGRPELGSSDAVASRTQVKGSGDNLGETISECSEVGSTPVELEEWTQPSMANTISNMKMTNPIKGLVSKRRKRFTEDGFDLDLTYIQTNLIAMGFPAEKLEGVYRNHIDDVVKFLESRHKDHYKIYNLCKERSYDPRKFKNRVAEYPFDDHNPPNIEQIKPFCEDVHNWLSQDCKNIAAVHCKAGKGRTGVMVACYLLHTKQFPTALDALTFYGSKRTTDSKGVTIPSQRRYVGYYASFVQKGLIYQPVTLLLRQITLDPIPIFNGNQGYLHFVISEDNKRIFSSDTIEVKKGTPSIRIPLNHTVSITGDIRVDFFNKKPKMKRKEKLFHFWFNTFFVCDNPSSDNDSEEMRVERSARALSCDGTAMEFPAIANAHSKPRTSSLASLGPMPPTLVLEIDKWGLDDAHKDKSHKIFPSDFKVNLQMNRPWDGPGSGISQAVPAITPRTDVQIGMSGQESPSESSDADSSECDTTGDEDGWESVDMDQRVGRYRLLSDGGMIDVL